MKTVTGKPEASSYERLNGLRSRGLKISPKLATDEGVMGFRDAREKFFTDTRHHWYQVHKTANVMASLPKSV